MNDERHAPRPKLDHIIDVMREQFMQTAIEGVPTPHGDANAAHEEVAYRAICTCGWRSWVCSTDPELALEQGRKHANRLMRWPLTNKTLNLSLTLKSDQLEPQEVREIIRAAVREAHGE